MPAAIKHPCPGKGLRYGRCPNLIARGERQCAACEPYVKQVQRRYDQERDKGEQRQFLHSTTWRKIRIQKLSWQPLCERHLKRGATVAAILVHHRDKDETHNTDENLESLCLQCHEEEHKAERFRGAVNCSMESKG